MAEPTSVAAATTGLTVLSIYTLGPVVGPYVLIAACAVAGALWPLSVAKTATRFEGLMLVTRCVTLALVTSAFLAGVVERAYGMKADEVLPVVALVIGALGNGWRPVFAAIGTLLESLASKGVKRDTN